MTRTRAAVPDRIDRIGAGVLLAAIASSAFAPAASATTFTVTRADDPDPGSCLPADCSLREAVLAANANADADLILIPIGGSFALSRGALQLTQSVQVRGADAGTTTVEGDGTARVFQIFGAIDVTLSRLTILGHGEQVIDVGAAADTLLEFVTIPENDTSITESDCANAAGSLEIRTSQIQSGLGVSCLARLRISDSLVTRLQVGVGNDSQVNFELLRSTLDGDLANGAFEAGIAIQTNGTVTITDSTIRHAERGLEFNGPVPASVLLDRLSYTGNPKPLIASNAASITVVDSDFSDNVRDPQASGAAALAAVAGSTWDISRSTFAGNIGSGGPGIVGGAVVVQGAHVAIRNSTFSSNSFGAANAADSRGAAIGFVSDASGTSLSLQHVTIVPPTIAPAGILGTALGGFGGETGLVLDVSNSIVRGTCALDAGAMDIAVGNIESPGDSCDFDSDLNLVNVGSGALALGSLDDHGGATRTYEPGIFSVAVDNPGSAAFCADTDQRGYQRPFGAGCDAGAVERGAQDRVFADGFE